MTTVKLEVELPEDEAYALAELCKRLTFSDANNCAVDREEAYRMLFATNKVRDGLVKSGVVVR